MRKPYVSPDCLSEPTKAQAEATKSAQRAGIDHKRRAQPSAYLRRKPSYDRATFDRIRFALDSASPPSLDSASPPSLSTIAKAERLSKQTVFRLKQDPQAALAALDAWGL
jgi:putative DNA-invertase from lambdoid prophage Rac